MAGTPPPDVTLHEGDDDVLVTGEAIALDLRPTGFILNCVAGAIDLVVYLGGGSALLNFVIVPAIKTVFGRDSATLAAGELASAVLFLMVIPLIVELLSHGRSLGRLAVGARVVRDDGGAIGFRHAFIRSLLAVLEVFGSFGSIAAITALFNERAKRLGDLLAGTFSQYERVSKEVVPVYGVPVELVAWSTTADVGRLPDRLARRMSQFLRQASHLTPDTRVRISADLAAEASRWVYPVPATNPELFIAAVIAMRRQRELTGHLLERARLAQVETALTGLPHGFPER